MLVFSPTLPNSPPIFSLGLSDASPVRICTQQIYFSGHAPASFYDNLRPDTAPDTQPWNNLRDYLKSHKLYNHEDRISVTELVNIPFSSSCADLPVSTGQTGPTNWTTPSSLTQFSINAYDRGIGYGHSETTVPLSLAVLAIYGAIVIIYLIIIISVTGKTATSWDSIGELVALVLNTQRPGHMQNMSVGVDVCATYARPVNVRVNGKGSVEMVFDDDIGVRRRGFTVVEVNEKY